MRRQRLQAPRARPQRSSLRPLSHLQSANDAASTRITASFATQGSTKSPSGPLFATVAPTVSAAPATGAPDPSTTVPRTSAAPGPHRCAVHAHGADSSHGHQPHGSSRDSRDHSCRHLGRSRPAKARPAQWRDLHFSPPSNLRSYLRSKLFRRSIGLSRALRMLDHPMAHKSLLCHLRDISETTGPSARAPGLRLPAHGASSHLPLTPSSIPVSCRPKPKTSASPHI